MSLAKTRPRLQSAEGPNLDKDHHLKTCQIVCSVWPKILPVAATQDEPYFRRKYNIMPKKLLYLYHVKVLEKSVKTKTVLEFDKQNP